MCFISTLIEPFYQINVNLKTISGQTPSAEEDCEQWSKGSEKLPNWTCGKLASIFKNELLVKMKLFIWDKRFLHDNNSLKQDRTGSDNLSLMLHVSANTAFLIQLDDAFINLKQMPSGWYYL